MINRDSEHVCKLGDLKDTKYWFRRDIGTMKKGLKKTVSQISVLLLATFVFSLFVNYANQTLRMYEVVVLSVMFLPIFMLGYFLFYIMVNKGHNIHASGGGTVIDDSRNKMY